MNRESARRRLADELYQSCVRQGHAAARSRCYAGQGQVAYAPVAEWLRSDAVRAGWTNLRPQQLAELARLVPEIREQFPELELLKSGQPSPLAESWQRLHFYESLSAAFGKSRKPMLLYLDDMQWCDPDSFEWLNALLTSSAAAGVLVLGTVRAEETGREHPFTRFLAGLRQSGMVLEIPLEPLDAEETAELARLESAKPLESGNLGEIFRATRGNPLFVVESVRAGLQSTRVHAVIAARLAQLTAASYELAGVASVVGRPFSFELLEKATDWDEAQRFPRARRTVAAAYHRKPRSFGVRFHARPPARSGLRGTEPGAPALFAPARGAGAGRGVWGRHRKLERADCFAFRTGRNGGRGDRALWAGGCLCAATICGHGSGGPAEARAGAVPGIFRI